MYTDDFESFWQNYPSKKAKGYCHEKWRKLKAKGDLPDIRTIIMALNNQKKERIMLRSKNRFVPEWKHPSTWLNQMCWDDGCEIEDQQPLIKRQINPVQTLHEAYRILTELGQDKFREFCESSKLSDGDIEVVLNKFNMTFNVEPLVRSMFR